MPMLRGYDATLTFLVGPGDTYGDGITFAMIEASSTPGVGDNGDGLGLRNIIGGGLMGGYAVALDMFKNPGDLDKTTLKIIAMPSFTVVAQIGVPFQFNDGIEYPVDVSWRAPSSIVVTVHT